LNKASVIDPPLAFIGVHRRAFIGVHRRRRYGKTTAPAKRHPNLHVGLRYGFHPAGALTMSARIPRFASCLVLPLFAGCAAAPMSMLDGNPITRADSTLHALRVVAVDGQAYFENPVRVAPGPRSVMLQPPPVAGMRTSPVKAYAIKVAPCTRYYLAAKRATPVSVDWEMVIERTEPVNACDREAEIKKAGL
jgi:hypothetical protein